MSFKLRPYQSEACRSIVGEFEKGIEKTLLILPTGCGKTVVFNGVAFRYAYNKDRTPNGGKVLVLAHQNLLIEQAAEKFSSVMGIQVSREKGKTHCLNSEFPITVSSMQTMQNRLEQFPNDYFDLIIIDEAHHVMSAGYQKILKHFRFAKVLGVTATPDRADKKKLTCFESVAFEYTISQAQKEGYLSPLNVVSSPLKIDISKVRKSHGDLIGSDIGTAVEPYLHDIAKEIRRLAKGRRIVCFVPLIRTAKKAAEIFSHYGFRSEWTSGDDKQKDEKLERFASGEYDIIFNSMLLTEGWDCPETDCVVVLRPTMSRALYVQMIGRGLRLAEGKTDCLLVDFLFQHDGFSLVSPKDILEEKPKKSAGFNPWIGTGGGQQEDAESRLARKLEEAARKYEHLKDPFETFSDVLQTMPNSDLFDPPCSKTQTDNLVKMGFNPIGITYGQAQAIFESVKAKEPASSKQAYRLKKLGFTTHEIQSMSFLKAKKELAKAKAMGRW